MTTYYNFLKKVLHSLDQDFERKVLTSNVLQSRNFLDLPLRRGNDLTSQVVGDSFGIQDHKNICPKKKIINKYEIKACKLRYLKLREFPANGIENEII